jgi:hypothetical protein
MTQAERAEQRVLLAHIRRDARTLARDFKLELRSIDAERANVKSRYGICYDDGSIRIRLRHARTRKLLKYSALIDTLCHELAHLRHFNHGERFQALYRGLLARARSLGIYRPAPRWGSQQPRPRSRDTVVLRASSILPLARLGEVPRRPRRVIAEGEALSAAQPGTVRQTPEPPTVPLQLELF